MGPVRIKARQRPKKPKISKLEFTIIKQVLENLEIEFESDNTLTFHSSSINCGTRSAAFPEKYRYLSEISRDQILLNPLKSEKHANIVIDMFEELNPTCVTEIIAENDLFSGTIENITNNEILAEIRNIPTIPLLKTMLISSIIVDEYSEELRDMFYEFIDSGEI